MLGNLFEDISLMANLPKTDLETKDPRIIYLTEKFIRGFITFSWEEKMLMSYYDPVFGFVRFTLADARLKVSQRTPTRGNEHSDANIGDDNRGIQASALHRPLCYSS